MPFHPSKPRHPQHPGTDLSAGELTTLLKRHAVITNPDTGQGLVCMWCGDQPAHELTETHQARILAPLILALREKAWDEGHHAGDGADLFSEEPTNPYRRTA